MSEPIDHHYLPVFYLCQWCDARGKVVRYYRPHKTVVASPITPKYTGYEPYLYSLPGNPPGKEQAIETDFMARAVDEPASKALPILIERNQSAMTEEMRRAWVRFLMAMRLRDPHSLTEISALAHEITKTNLLIKPEEYLAIKGDDDPPNLYEWLQECAPHYMKNIGKMFLPGIIDNENVGNHIINMRWLTLDLSPSGRISR